MNNQQKIHPELRPDFKPEMPESHHLPTWIWIVVIVIIGLLAIGLVAYGAYQYLSSNDQDGCVTLYEPVCGKDGKTYSNFCVADLDGAEVDYMGKCEVDEFEDWLIYKDDEHGYEIKYPDGWEVEKEEGRNDFFEYDYRYLVFGDLDSDARLSLGIEKKGSDVHLGQPSGISYSPVPGKTVKLGSEEIKAYYFLDGTNKVRDIWYQDPNKGLEIDGFEVFATFRTETLLDDGYTIQEVSDLEEFEIANQILSTFKFID